MLQPVSHLTLEPREVTVLHELDIILDARPLYSHVIADPIDNIAHEGVKPRSDRVRRRFERESIAGIKPYDDLPAGGVYKRDNVETVTFLCDDSWPEPQVLAAAIQPVSQCFRKCSR
jgi:hypothetical protein